MKLYSSWTVGALSIKNERANSAYLKEPKTYNTIDIDYRIRDIDVNDEEKKVDTSGVDTSGVEISVIES